MDYLTPHLLFKLLVSDLIIVGTLSFVLFGSAPGRLNLWQTVADRVVVVGVLLIPVIGLIAVWTI